MEVSISRGEHNSNRIQIVMFVIFIKKKNEIFILIHYPQQAHLSKINVISKKVTAKPHILKKIRIHTT